MSHGVMPVDSQRHAKLSNTNTKDGIRGSKFESLLGGSGVSAAVGHSAKYESLLGVEMVGWPCELYRKRNMGAFEACLGVKGAPYDIILHTWRGNGARTSLPSTGTTAFLQRRATPPAPNCGKSACQLGSAANTGKHRGPRPWRRRATAWRHRRLQLRQPCPLHPACLSCAWR